jgi:phenylacetic acid degradation protein paaN
MAIQHAHGASSPALTDLFAKHEGLLKEALAALHSRTFYAAYPESDKAYGEEAPKAGLAAYQAQIGQPFSRLRVSYDAQLVSDEASPYTGEKLGISYPVATQVQHYINRGNAAFTGWRAASAADRAAVLIEALDRIKGDFFEIAHATMHTTGQAYMMSFQASGPHANDRALEAVALGYQELTRFPDATRWEKPMGKVSINLQKYYKTVPRGLALAIGCSTFPVWNTVPGVFASLITGNPVIVKAHPLGIYSIAIVVARIQEVLAEYGFDPAVVQLAVDTVANPVTKHLAEHPDIKLIDFTGGSAFGSIVESLPGKITFTEKAGVNSVILDSAADLKAVVDNLAFSVSLYSGQMCTAPQNIFVPKGGITVGGEHKSFDEVAQAIADGVKGLVGHPKAGPAIAGAIQSDAAYQRAKNAATLGGKVLLESQPIPNPEYPNARTLGPAVIALTASDEAIFSQECFGPVVFVIATDSTEHSLALASNLAARHGAISCGAWTTNPEVMDAIAERMAAAATPVSFNLAGPIYVNQNAGFSDFHVTGGNPAGNASFTNPEFVVKRFVTVGIRVNG